MLEQPSVESSQSYPIDQTFSGMVEHSEIFRLAAEAALRRLLLDSASSMNTENTFRLIDIALDMSMKSKKTSVLEAV